MPNIQPVIPPTGPFSSLQGAFQPKVSNLFLEQSGQKESVLPSKGICDLLLLFWFLYFSCPLLAVHALFCEGDTSLLTHILKLNKLKCNGCLMAVGDFLAMIETLEGYLSKNWQPSMCFFTRAKAGVISSLIFSNCINEDIQISTKLSPLH